MLSASLNKTLPSVLHGRIGKEPISVIWSVTTANRNTEQEIRCKCSLFWNNTDIKNIGAMVCANVANENPLGLLAFHSSNPDVKISSLTQISESGQRLSWALSDNISDLA